MGRPNPVCAPKCIKKGTQKGPTFMVRPKVQKLGPDHNFYIQALFVQHPTSKQRPQVLKTAPNFSVQVKKCDRQDLRQNN